MGMYTCAEQHYRGGGGSSSSLSLHPAVRNALDFDAGTEHTLEMAKLGNEALRRFQEFDVNDRIEKCSDQELATMDSHGYNRDYTPPKKEDEPAADSAEAAAARASGALSSF